MTSSEARESGTADRRLLALVGILVLMVGGCSSSEPAPPDQPTASASAQGEPPSGEIHLGPFGISNNVISTDLLIHAGWIVRTSSYGSIDFGGAVAGIGAPKLDADGDSSPTPPNYPAPELRKNSLICKVGSLWYQCGTNASFRPFDTGTLTLQPNDAQLEDNSRGWTVDVFVVWGSSS
jgi:hypothetical protein